MQLWSPWDCESAVHGCDTFSGLMAKSKACPGLGRKGMPAYTLLSLDSLCLLEVDITFTHTTPGLYAHWRGAGQLEA